MKPYLLTEIPGDIFNAGFKAKNDICRALEGQVVPLNVKECFRWDKIPTFLRLLAQLRKIPKGGRLYIQCPIYTFFNHKFLPLICRTLRRRQLRVVLIIHDVDSLRYPDRADSLRPVERELYDLAEKIIVHNACMQAKLAETHGVPVEKTVVLGIFDYLMDKPAVKETAYSRSVFVAGNLDPEKSGYIYRLGEIAEGMTVNLYGGHFAADRAGERLHYIASFPPDELPAHLLGDFGLIWDGDALDSCRGQTGDYLRINNPHKTSLYLASGFPVVIWSEAALAPFIVENGLGLAVDDLAKLPAMLAALTPEEYAAMRDRVAEYGARLRAGGYIRAAVAACEQ